MREDTQRWLRQRTTTGEQWSRDRLTRAKDGRTVSVVLPARNEAATVGTIVRAIRRELVDAVGLVDEVLVVDSGSIDATAAVARRAGATVVDQRAVLTRLADVPGKGEALWKSLLVAHGDVIAFIDADLSAFDPQVVVGLLGPLLTEDLGFVKGVYDRPLADGQTLLPTGGGRVTELVARPLLNLYWPQLAGFVQPLAGEYAATRAVLERVPFLSGYGVEIGMLVDVLEEFGLWSMAQVDLGSRAHRNSTDAALGRMAAQVQLAMLSRLRRHGRIILDVEVADRLTQFVRSGANYVAEDHDVSVSERPPMITVPEYLEIRATRSG